jgi:hypothetical protein
MPFFYLLLLSVFLYAEEDFEEDLELFDDTPAIIIPKDTTEVKKHTFKMDLSLATAYNYAHKAPQEKQTDYRGLSRLKRKMNIALDSKWSSSWQSKLEISNFYDFVYDLNDRDYSEDVIDTYQSEFEVREAYVQGSLSKQVDLKIGRQIVIWGKSDSIRLNDVINPLDNRELGMTDIEDLRLPVFMTKLDYYIGAWNISTMIIHESRTQKEAGIGSDYLPTHIFPLPKGSVFPKDTSPESTIENTQFALALNGTFTGWDLSFYTAKVLDSKWHFENNKKIRTYSPIRIIGLADAVVLSSWLLKSEIAYIQDLKYNSTIDEKNRFDALIGLEYNGIKNLNTSIEIANRHLLDYETKMQKAPDFTYNDEQQIASRISYSFNHEKGLIGFLHTVFTAKNKVNGGFSRLWLNYDLTDNIEYNIGVIDYIGGEKLFLDAISNNDKVFADISYHF